MRGFITILNNLKLLPGLILLLMGLLLHNFEGFLYHPLLFTIILLLCNYTYLLKKPLFSAITLLIISYIIFFGSYVLASATFFIIRSYIVQEVAWEQVDIINSKFLMLTVYSTTATFYLYKIFFYPRLSHRTILKVLINTSASLFLLLMAMALVQGYLEDDPVPFDRLEVPELIVWQVVVATGLQWLIHRQGTQTALSK